MKMTSVLCVTIANCSAGLRSAARLMFVCVAVILSGCSDADWQADTYPASGRLMINGQPPQGAVVELHSISSQPDVRNSRPWAVVDAQGQFTLTTYLADDGAPAGEYAVVVRWPPDVSEMSLADRLGGAYADADDAPFRVTIRQQENKIPELRINDAKVADKDQVAAPRKAPPGPAMSSTP